MTDQFDALKATYKFNVPAAALFFRNVTPFLDMTGPIPLPKVVKALRVDVPDIGKEFTDGAYIGKDPEGFLYYNDPDDFDKTPVYYTVSKLINTDKNKTVCAHIQFYHDSSRDVCHAEFLAEDPTYAVTGADMDNYQSSGNWEDLNIGSATASIRKKTDENTITVTIDSINMTATIPVPDNVLFKTGVNVKGNFFFKNTITIDTGKYASYNDDRIVFYSNDFTGKDFTGYFIPFEYSPNKPGIKSDNTQIFENISWKST